MIWPKSQKPLKTPSTSSDNIFFSKSEKEKNLSKENHMFLSAKEVLSQKIVDLEKKFSETKLFIGLEQDNKKHEKRRLSEDNKKLPNKVRELKEKLKTLEENDESSSDG